MRAARADSLGGAGGDVSCSAVRESPQCAAPPVRVERRPASLCGLTLGGGARDASSQPLPLLALGAGRLPLAPDADQPAGAGSPLPLPPLFGASLRRLPLALPLGADSPQLAGLHRPTPAPLLLAALPSLGASPSRLPQGPCSLRPAVALGLLAAPLTVALPVLA